MVSAEWKALGLARERQATGIAGAISAGQEQVCLLSLKPGIRGAQFPLLAKPKAVFCAKMRRDVQNTFIAHRFPSWAPVCDFSKGGGSAGFSISRCCSPDSEQHLQTSHGRLSKAQPTCEERGKDEKSLIALCKAWHSIERDFSSWEQHTSAAVTWWMFQVVKKQVMMASKLCSEVPHTCC